MPPAPLACVQTHSKDTSKKMFFGSSLLARRHRAHGCRFMKEELKKPLLRSLRFIKVSFIHRGLFCQGLFKQGLFE